MSSRNSATRVDGLLSRLETAFESQRRFVANASHELRTPITVERTLVEVALADPGVTVESLKATCERVLASSEQQERLIEALLTLARSQRGLERREPLDLAGIARRVLCDQLPRDGISLHKHLAGASTTAIRRSSSGCVANLLDNAHKYNTEPGSVQFSTGTRAGRSLLTVQNTGPVIAEAQAPDLTEPFRRLNGERTAHSRGLGLGLSIVDAIATAHGAELRTLPRAGGGLDVEVAFPGGPHPHRCLDSTKTVDGIAGDASPIRVALIDDDSGLLTVLDRRFAALRWQREVLSYAAGPDQLAALRLHAAIVNPAVTGLDYLGRIAGALPGMALLVCTGPAPVAERVRGLREGADDWITKPCHPEELVARIQAVLRRRRTGELPAEGGDHGRRRARDQARSI